MKTIKLFALAVLVSAASNVLAQKTKVTSGTFSELKGQTEVNVVWDYSEAQVRGGSPFAKWKALPEAEWLQKIVDKKKPEPVMTGRKNGRLRSQDHLSQASKPKWLKCGKALALSMGLTTRNTPSASR